MTSFVNVAQGVMNPGQVAQSINTAQQGIREQTDWGNAQLLKNIYSSSLNPDGSLRQSEFLSKAAKAGVGPAGVKSWLDTQNATNEAAKTQTINNAIQKLYGLNPQELRDRNQLPDARQQAAGQFAPKATTGMKATTQAKEAEPGKDESQTNDTQGEGLLGKIASGVKGLFGGNEPDKQLDEPEATKASYAYLTPTERYESDKPLEERAGVVGDVVPAARKIVGYDDNFNAIYDDSGYKIDNQGMLTQNSSGMLGSNVGIVQDPNALAQGGQFTAVAPSADNGIRPPQRQVTPQPQAPAPQQAPDNRSILERLADSGTGMPSTAALGGAGQMPTSATADKSLFEWNVPATDTNQYRNYKGAQDALLGSHGFSDAGSYLKSIYDQTLLANAAPGINPMALMEDPTNPGKGLSKIGEQIVAHAQGNQQAEGKARAAVMAAKSQLSDLANKYGVQTVEQRRSELGGGMVLRDPASRQTAVTLLSNRSAIDETLDQLNNAKTQIDVQMVAPMVAKVVGMSYGTQPSEFNIAEVYKSAFPDMDKDLVTKLALGTVAAVKNGNWAGVSRLLDNINPADPAAIRKNLYHLLKTANETTETQIKGHVIGGGGHKLGGLSEYAGEAPKVPTGADAMAPKPTPKPTAAPKAGGRKPLF